MPEQVPKKNTMIPDLMIIAGAIIILIPIMWSIRSSVLQSYEAAKWDEQSAAVDDQSPVPDSSANSSQRYSLIPHVMPPSKIIIPRLGLDAVIVEEIQESDLDRGPMHLVNTAIAGYPGNCCIAAHKEKWFRGLGKLKRGDKVFILTKRERYTYIVTGQKIVNAEDISVLQDTQKPTLTLITCVGPAYFGRGNGRLIVTSVLKGAK